MADEYATGMSGDYDATPAAAAEPMAADVKIAIDDAGQVAEDLACRACGYNLRGVALLADCPECGAGVAWSAEGDYLRFCDPVWLQRLSQGLLFVLISIGMAFFLGCVGGMLPLMDAGETGPATVAGQLLLCVSPVLSVLGYWWLTEPEPGAENRPLRAWTRWLMVSSNVLAIIGGLAGIGSEQAGLLFDGVAGVGALIGAFLVFMYLRQLALRIPHESLASQTRIVLWGIAGSYALLVGALILLVLALVFTVQGSSGPGAAVFGGVAVLAAIPLLVFSIWSLVLLVWYRIVLARLQLEALTLWQAAEMAGRRG